MSNVEVIGSGRAKCVMEPRGDGGLEGYNRGDVYRFERIRAATGRTYVRVYNGDDGYRETCGTGTFNRFFEVIAESVPESAPPATD
jgi:hypothetical protein